jgi:hypothetical protein
MNNALAGNPCTSYNLIQTVCRVFLILDFRRVLNIVDSAYEDGPDRRFRNVGNYKPDAGELP